MQHPVLARDFAATLSLLSSGPSPAPACAQPSPCPSLLLPGLLQNPVLAREDTWAHATGAPEVGGLLLATPDTPRILGDEYWQAVVFLVQHGEQGSLGLLLNRPTGLNMGRGRGGLPMRAEVSGWTAMQALVHLD